MDFTQNPKYNFFSKLAGVLFVIVPLFIYYWFVNRFVLNIPSADEYVFALKWFLEYYDSHFTDIFHFLFKQAGEYRIFSYCATVLSSFLVFGEINFRYMTLLSNLSIIGLLYVLFKLARLDKNQIIYFAPVSLFILIPQYMISNWTLVVMGFIFQHLLVIASLYLLNKQGIKSMFFAILLAFVATFSFGNGMFVYLCGFIILFINPQKNWKDRLIWLSSMIVNILLFFSGYEAAESSDFISEFLGNPMEFMQFFVVFFGNVISPVFKRDIIILTISGMAVLLYFCYLLFFKWKSLKKYPVTIAVLFFILISAAAVTLSRISWGIIIGATVHRYLIVVFLFLAVLYIASIQVFKSFGKKSLMFVMIGSLVLYGFRINENWHLLNYIKNKLSTGLISYYNNEDPIALNYFDKEKAVKILELAVERGIYNPPSIAELYGIECKKNRKVTNDGTYKIHYHVDDINIESNLLTINGWAFLNHDNRKNQKVGIFLRSGSESIFVSAKRIYREGVVMHFEKRFDDVPYFCGFHFLLNSDCKNLPPGIYQVGVFIEQNGEVIAVKMTDHEVDLLPSNKGFQAITEKSNLLN